MDESTKRRRAGVVIAAVGAGMLALWLALRAGLAVPALGPALRVFLPVVGAPLLLAGLLVAWSGRRPADADSPGGT